MLCSIVTVTLNPGSLLQATLDSVHAQSSGDWEMLIQDGGSDDGSLEKIESDSRVQVVVEQDGGIYDAMNRALGRAKGDYLVFLNAGDCLAESNLISKVVALAEEEKSPDLIFCNYRNLTSGRELRLPDRLDTISLFRALYCHQAIFFSRKLFQELGGYETAYPIRADLEFLYRCHAKFPGLRVSHLGVCGVLYEGSGFSARSEIQALKAKELNQIRRQYLPRWKLLGFAFFHELTLVRLRTWWFHHRRKVS